MEEIVKEGITPSEDIYFIATVDEEDSMKGSKALLKESFLDTIPLIIVCEPTGLKICTAGKGRTYANLKITGQTGHVVRTLFFKSFASSILITRLDKFRNNLVVLAVFIGYRCFFANYRECFFFY